MVEDATRHSLRFVQWTSTPHQEDLDTRSGVEWPVQKKCLMFMRSCQEAAERVLAEPRGGVLTPRTSSRKTLIAQVDAALM